ncbi:hypothetical protein ACJX0J_025491, partial [Zea mays]
IVVFTFPYEFTSLATCSFEKDILKTIFLQGILDNHKIQLWTQGNDQHFCYNNWYLINSDQHYTRIVDEALQRFVEAFFFALKQQKVGEIVIHGQRFAFACMSQYQKKGTLDRLFGVGVGNHHVPTYAFCLLAHLRCGLRRTFKYSSERYLSGPKETKGFLYGDFKGKILEVQNPPIGIGKGVRDSINHLFFECHYARFSIVGSPIYATKIYDIYASDIIIMASHHKS